MEKKNYKICPITKLEAGHGEGKLKNMPITKLEAGYGEGKL